MSENQKKKSNIKDVAVGAVIGVGVKKVYDDLTGQEFAQFETTDGNVVSIWTDTDNNGIYDTEFVVATPLEETEQDFTEEEEEVQAEIVPINDDGMSFSEAFLDARNELGAGGVFEWNGQSYNTFLAEEWGNMSNEQHNEWASLPTDDKLEYYSNIDESDFDNNTMANEDVLDDFDNDFDDESYDNNDAGDWELV